jgi:hypothetical protein
VIGLSLGIPLEKIATGPFYQFQNSDSDEDSLLKLIGQLASRIERLSPSEEVVKDQIARFIEYKTSYFKSQPKEKTPGDDNIQANQLAAAKLYEEVKLLVRGMSNQLSEMQIPSSGISKIRLHKSFSVLLDEMLCACGTLEAPTSATLIISSVFRDDLPWMYELGMELFRKANREGLKNCRQEFYNYYQTYDNVVNGPLSDLLVDIIPVIKYLRELKPLNRRIESMMLDFDLDEMPVIQGRANLKPAAKRPTGKPATKGRW